MKNKLEKEATKRFEDAEFYYHIHQGYVGSVKQFISQEKQLSKQQMASEAIVALTTALKKQEDSIYGGQLLDDFIKELDKKELMEAKQ